MNSPNKEIIGEKLMAKSIMLATLAMVLVSSLESPVRADVRRSIEMNVAGSPMYPIPDEWPAIPSPNGQREALITYHGTLEDNTLSYDLILFDHGRTGGIIGYHRLAYIKSKGRFNNPGLSRLRWSINGLDLYALVASEDALPQITKISARTGELSPLTKSDTGVVDYAMDRTGSVIVYLERPVVAATLPASGTYAGEIVNDESPYALIQGRDEANDQRGFWRPNVLRVAAGGSLVTVALGTGEKPMTGMGLSVSPDGRFVVIPVAMMRSSMPQNWDRSVLTSSQVFIYGLRLLDRTSGKVRWLIEEPMEPGSVAWSDDSESVFVSGLMRSDQTKESGGRVSAIIDIGGRGRITILPGDFVIANQVSDIGLARIKEKGRPNESGFKLAKRGGSWHLSRWRRPQTSIRQVQDYRHPPTLVEHNLGTGKERLVLDLNPLLQHSKLNTVEQFTWHATSGEVLTGGLYYPRGFVRGQRYPLVIQTHGWDPNQFWYDGPSTAGFAAQSLADEGFFVAQIGEVSESLSTPSEGSTGADMLDTLIDALDRKGLIDISHVGITAWSRTGLFVRYALAFGRHKYAAAVLVDSQDGGYLSYLLADAAGQYDMEHQMGGSPFGYSLGNWATRSPMFNIDRVNTPIRLVKLGPHILDHWENWANLHQMRRSIEFVWLPDANHWPIQPAERMEVQQGAVDWYLFWLRNVKSTNENEQSAYERWDAMRAPINARSMGGKPINSSPFRPSSSKAK